jgi:hypothetical protein
VQTGVLPVVHLPLQQQQLLALDVQAPSGQMAEDGEPPLATQVEQERELLQ